MQQPDLGKKIAKLRKARGLTQEELVEKCNLNVRTLQRIEAGEVTPRSYTVKLIFAALGHEVYNSLPGTAERSGKTTDQIRDMIRKACSYTLDLFNLKTNAMKKLTILSVIFLTFCAVIFSACLSSRRVVNDKKALLGTWQIMNNGVPDTTYGGQPGQIRYQTITGDRFMVTDIQYSKKQIYAAFSGSYTLDTQNKTYSVLIEAIGGPGYAQYMNGKIGTFNYRLKDSLLYLKGNGYDEVWKRVR
ncbi:helix-turn-helix domain-containing protein [Mucilaginibacter sp. SJ]|uniref:helix-turn-helix domain-containing protein n=1 Tax=Mucilaginibacter sp. SJ TaxID=3029053 RepID=UPI0023A96D0E|nr:helix-turn-helix domain-containing protein [Mucilaginibacter sp. SJ]WEA02310.1 helix-turn-helix domain-containing protein [Mucilaginibacter sp. SJ]